MFTFDSIILELRGLFEHEYRMRESARSLQTPSLQDPLNKQASQWESLIKEKLRELVCFPPHHSRHQSRLDGFHVKAKYEQSIFIMTKFPDGDTQLDKQLTAVINAVSKAITECGFSARIASQSDLHPFIWDNVELYLLGCCKAVAIVEDRYKPELNPNVAMEWGWMRGMGRDVLFLVENKFNHHRADWAGLLEHRFSWEKPNAGIDLAIKKWLTGAPPNKPESKRNRAKRPNRT